MRPLAVLSMYEVDKSGMWKIQAFEYMPDRCAGARKQQHGQNAEKKQHGKLPALFLDRMFPHLGRFCPERCLFGDTDRE